MKKELKDFTSLYQVAETLTFELRPIGKTEENIQKSGILQQDLNRADAYPLVKKFLDEQHKQLLQQVLSAVDDIHWQPLAKALSDFQENKDLKTQLEKIQEDYRKKIIDKFIKDELYSFLVKETTPSKLFAKLLKESSEGASDEIKTFARFACYFKGYQENRKNIYSKEAQQTSVAYRAVNENFSKFYNAVNIFQTLQQNFPVLITDITARTMPLLKGKKLEDIFKIDSYNQFLPQTGIDFLNLVIGEINYAVNQYRQQHKDIKSSQLPFIPLLFKQILSDREQAFTIESFENDKDLCTALQHFAENNKNADILGNRVPLFSSLCQELKNIHSDSDLFTDAKSLTAISLKTLGAWSRINEAVSAFAESNFKSKKEREKYCNQAVFHFSEIKKWGLTVSDEEGISKEIDIADFWNGEYASSLFEKEKGLADVFEKIICEEHKNLREDKEKIHIIKEYLDTVQEIFHLLKPLIVGEEYGGDLNLCGILKAYYVHLEKVIPLYNYTRNYVSKKATDVGKMKLMFDKPTLADGWDNNKEKDNHSVIFIKNGCYFLGIMNPKAKTDFSDLVDDSSPSSYQKMVYKLLPGPNKMLPKVFFSKKGIETFAPDSKLLNSYGNNEHIKK